MCFWLFLNSLWECRTSLSGLIYSSTMLNKFFNVLSALSFSSPLSSAVSFFPLWCLSEAGEKFHAGAVLWAADGSMILRVSPLMSDHWDIPESQNKTISFGIIFKKKFFLILLVVFLLEGISYYFFYVCNMLSCAWFLLTCGKGFKNFPVQEINGIFKWSLWPDWYEIVMDA